MAWHPSLLCRRYRHWGLLFWAHNWSQNRHVRFGVGKDGWYFSCSSPTLSFLSLITHHIGGNFILSPTFLRIKNLRWRQNISSGNNQLLFAKTLHCRLMPPHTVILTEIDYHPMYDNWTGVFGNFVSLWECYRVQGILPSPIPMAFSNTYSRLNLG